MTTITATATAKLAELISNLPEVKKLISDEAKKEREQTHIARLACLQALKEARAQLAQAEKNRDVALAELEAARAAAKEKEPALHKAANELNLASEMVGRLTNRLSSEHGEKHVLHGLCVLNLMMNESAKRLNILEEKQFITRYDDAGRAVWRSENYEIKAAVETAKEDLSHLENTFVKMQALTACELHPDDIEKQARALLEVAGCRPNPELWSEG